MSPLYSCYITDRSLPPPDDHRYGNNHTLPFKTLMTDYSHREKKRERGRGRERKTERKVPELFGYGTMVIPRFWIGNTIIFFFYSMILIPWYYHVFGQGAMVIVQNCWIVYIKVPWYYQIILWSNHLSDLHLYCTKHHDNNVLFTEVPYNTT